MIMIIHLLAEMLVRDFVGKVVALLAEMLGKSLVELEKLTSTSMSESPRNEIQQQSIALLINHLTVNQITQSANHTITQ